MVLNTVTVIVFVSHASHTLGHMISNTVQVLKYSANGSNLKCLDVATLVRSASMFDFLASFMCPPRAIQCGKCNYRETRKLVLSKVENPGMLLPVMGILDFSICCYMFWPYSANDNYKQTKTLINQNVGHILWGVFAKIHGFFKRLRKEPNKHGLPRLFGSY